MLKKVLKNVGVLVPSIDWTCIRDLQTSAGNIATQRETPPIPPQTTVLSAPAKVISLLLNEMF